jgi:hypothetical protein
MKKKHRKIIRKKRCCAKTAKNKPCKAACLRKFCKRHQKTKKAKRQNPFWSKKPSFKPEEEVLVKRKDGSESRGIVREVLKDNLYKIIMFDVNGLAHKTVTGDQLRKLPVRPYTKRK